VAVKAKIHTINGFSAHADRRDLLAWATQFRTDPVFFITHGEPESSQALAKTFEENGIRSVVPEAGREYDLTGKGGKDLTAAKAPVEVAVSPDVPCSGLGAVEAVLCEIVSIATELREDGSTVRGDEALNLAVSARTLLRSLKREKEVKKVSE